MTWMADDQSSGAVAAATEAPGPGYKTSDQTFDRAKGGQGDLL